MRRCPHHWRRSLVTGNIFIWWRRRERHWRLGTWCIRNRAAGRRPVHGSCWRGRPLPLHRGSLRRWWCLGWSPCCSCRITCAGACRRSCIGCPLLIESHLPLEQLAICVQTARRWINSGHSLSIQQAAHSRGNNEHDGHHHQNHTSGHRKNRSLLYLLCCKRRCDVVVYPWRASSTYIPLLLMNHLVSIP